MREKVLMVYNTRVTYFLLMWQNAKTDKLAKSKGKTQFHRREMALE